MSIRTIKRDIKYWFQRRVRGWSDDETWNLDYEFIKSYKYVPVRGRLSE